jgi:hypothetical protein
MFVSLIDAETNSIVHIDNTLASKKKFKYTSSKTFESVRDLFDLIKIFNHLFIFPQLCCDADEEMPTFSEARFVDLDEEILESEIVCDFCFCTKKNQKAFDNWMDSRGKDLADDVFGKMIDALTDVAEFRIITKEIDLLEDVMDCDLDCENCEMHNEEEQEEVPMCPDCKKEQEEAQKKLLN